MRFHSLTYRMQLFLSMFLLILLSTVALAAVMASRSMNDIQKTYQDAFDSVTAQTNLSIDQVLSGAEKLSTLPLINEDVRKALTTDYSNETSQFVYDRIMIRNLVTQTNQLNTDILSAVFINKHGYTFDYGNPDFANTFGDIQLWAQAARDEGVRTWVAPLQKSRLSNLSSRNILPVVRLLWDVTTNRELGVMGVAINFDAVTDVLQSAEISNSQVLLLDRNNQLYYFSSEDTFSSGRNQDLLLALQSAGAEVTRENPTLSRQIKVGTASYSVHITYNKTADWKIVNFLDNSVIHRSAMQNLGDLLVIFFLIALFSFLLASLISRQLSRNVSQLVKQIDRCEVGTISALTLTSPTNREFSRIVDSYNRLNQRLANSMREIYSVQLNEKQTRLRMLQAQINPHFLYNTLNLMAALANIHDVPEIRTVATKMSELLRYNLKSGPVVTLGEEVEQVERYMVIQSIRFPDKYVIECALPEELRQMQVPAFILQPLVENSVIHGLDELETDGYVMVNCFVEFEALHILILDNGVGISPEKLEELQCALRDPKQESDGGSIGLTNVNQRIQTYCGKQYGIQITSTLGKGTMMELTLPLTEKLDPPFPIQ